jgi:hypothetical protein
MLLKIKYFGTSRLVESNLLDHAASIIGCNILLELLDPEDGGTNPSKSQYFFLYDTA